MAEATLSPNIGPSTNTVVVGGETTLDGSNPTAVSTGLSTITGVTLTISNGSAPGVGTSVLTYTVSGGTLSIFAFKPTSSSNPTLVASTGTETVSYPVVGY